MPTPPPARVAALDHVVVVVRDIEAALGWYRSLLAVEVERLEEWRAGQVVFVSLRIDDHTVVDLFEGEPEAGRVGHVALVVDGVDLDELAARDDLDVEMAPTPLWGARGEGLGLYLRDPDGNRIELRTYG